MINAPIKFIPGTLPEGTCFTTEQERFNSFSSFLAGYLPGNYTTWNIGPDEPAVEDRTKPWLRLNVDGSLDRPYVFSNGLWVAPYRVPSDSGEIMIWKQSSADLQLYDGGNANAVSDADGPFWEPDPDFYFKFPLGAGTSAAPLSTTVNVGDVGGEERHQLTVPELPKFTPDVTQAKFNGSNVGDFGGGGSIPSVTQTGNEQINAGIIKFTIPEIGGDVAHNTMPPYRGVIYAKRTARKYWTP